MQELENNRVHRNGSFPCFHGETEA